MGCCSLVRALRGCRPGSPDSRRSCEVSHACSLDQSRRTSRWPSRSLCIVAAAGHSGSSDCLGLKDQPVPHTKNPMYQIRTAPIASGNVTKVGRRSSASSIRWRIAVLNVVDRVVVLAVALLRRAHCGSFCRGQTQTGQRRRDAMKSNKRARAGIRFSNAGCFLLNSLGSKRRVSRGAVSRESHP